MFYQDAGYPRDSIYDTLMPCGRYEFGNEFLLVRDVGQDSDNVLLDDDGFIRFIDPIIGFNSPLVLRIKTALKSDDCVLSLVHDLYT